MSDLSQLTDEQLNQLAQARGIGEQTPNQSTNDLSGLTDEQLNQLAQARGITESKPKSFQERNLERAINFAKGAPQGIGNALVGGVQAATDVGEKAGQMIEKLYFGDNIQMNTFGNRLAAQVAKGKEEEAKLSPSERAGIRTGEILPYLTGGAVSGAKTAAITGSKLIGLATGGLVGGLEQGALSPQEQAGLESRAAETIKSGATGLVGGAALGAVAKAASATGSKIVDLGKDIISGYKARPVEAVKGFLNKPVETLDAVGSAIKDKSSEIYGAMRESGTVLKPQATKQIFTGIDEALADSGIMNKRLHGDTIGIISDLKEVSKSKKGKVSVEELDQYRQLLGDVVKKNTDVAGHLNADARKASIAIDKLDNVVENLKPELVSGGKEGINLLGDARQEWQRYRKFDSVTNLVKRADGDPNRLKSLTQTFVNNPKNLRGFSQAEKDALKNASRNSTGEGLLKAFGKFGFDLGSGRNIGNAALPVGSILLGGGQGALLTTVGTIARQAQKLSARGKIEDVLKLIQGQEPQVASKAIQQLSPKTRDYVITNLLTRGLSGGSNDAQASEIDPKLSQSEIRQQLQQEQQQYPGLMAGENVDQRTSEIKKRYYR